MFKPIKDTDVPNQLQSLITSTLFIPIGVQGPQGYTPYIGAGNIWYVNGISTGVNAVGPQGSQGIQGIPGDTPFVNANGYWQVGDKTTNILAQGPKGSTPYIQGRYWYIDGKPITDAQDGTPIFAQGKDGDTPFVNADGYWQIGDNVTETRAQGPKGETGATGPKGDKGDKGDTGAIGPKGETGATGPKGDKGDKGDTGPKGDTGATGPAGTGVNILGSYESESALLAAHPTGSAGDAYLVKGNLYVWSLNSETWHNAGNIQGSKGDKGDKGDKGETGPAGPEGKSTYEVWLDAGNEGTKDDFIETLQGETGPEGKSAYEIWLETGNEGTKDDFISTLQGPVGPAGPEGPVGPGGKSAYEVWKELGNTGTEQDFIEFLKSKVSINSEGFWVINSVVTTIRATGLSPHIGTESAGEDPGMWYIGTVNTGVKAQGERGPAAVVTISEKGTWVIDGIDTNKPSRGQTGPGVPSGGSVGQILVKTGPADSATEWRDMYDVGELEDKFTNIEDKFTEVDDTLKELQENVGDGIDAAIAGVRTELNAITKQVDSKQDALIIADDYNALTNRVATEKTVSNAISMVIDGAPDVFNTFKEFYEYLIGLPDDDKTSILEQQAANSKAIAANLNAIAANAEALTEVQLWTSTLSLQNGESVGSIQTQILEDGTKKGSTAHGKYSVAFNQNNEAYQRRTFASGGGNRAGMLKSEFNIKYPNGTDEHGYTYEKSNLDAFIAGGQESIARGRGAFIGGSYKVINDGKYSGALGGGSHEINGEYNVAVGGYKNKLTETAKNSTVFNGYEQIISSENSGAGGAYNDIASSNTHAFGLGLKTDGQHGHAKFLVGKYNDTSSYAIVQVGGGSSDSDRRNIVEVFENGTVQVRGTNGRIMAAIRADGRVMSYTLPQESEDFVRLRELASVEKDTAGAASNALTALNRATSALDVASSGGIQRVTGDELLATQAFGVYYCTQNDKSGKITAGSIYIRFGDIASTATLAKFNTSTIDLSEIENVPVLKSFSFTVASVNPSDKVYEVGAALTLYNEELRWSVTLPERWRKFVVTYIPNGQELYSISGMISDKTDYAVTPAIANMVVNRRGQNLITLYGEYTTDEDSSQVEGTEKNVGFTGADYCYIGALSGEFAGAVTLAGKTLNAAKHLNPGDGNILYRELTSSRSRFVDVPFNVSASSYMWFIIPTNLTTINAVTFNDATGFGITLQDGYETVYIVNNKGITGEYRAYRTAYKIKAAEEYNLIIK